MCIRDSASLFPDLIGAADYCNAFMVDLEKSRGGYGIDSARPEHSQSRDEPLDRPLSPQTELTEVEFRSVVSLLQNSSQGQYGAEDALIPLSKELSRLLASRKLVDWRGRESIQAEIKVKARALLRKYRYPEASQDLVISKILDVPVDEMEAIR